MENKGWVESYFDSKWKQGNSNNSLLPIDTNKLSNPNEWDIKWTLSKAYDTRDNQITGNEPIPHVDLWAAQDAFNKTGFGSQFKQAIDGYTDSRDSRYNAIDKAVRDAVKDDKNTKK